MINFRKKNSKNNYILVHTKNKITSKIDKKSLIPILLLIIVYSIGFSKVNAVPQEDYVGSVFCNMCHIDQFDEWNQTAHSQAYSDPTFQDQWQAEGSPDTCLSCHTTGYDASTGSLEFEDVGCESCHLPTEENNVDTSSTCNSCHSATQFPTHIETPEIEHSHIGVDCASCHDPMSLEIRTEAPNGLCLDCHAVDAIEPVAENHGLGFECLDCHTITSLVDSENENDAGSGHILFPSESTPDCSSCHDVTLDAHNGWGATTDNCMICHDSESITMLHLLDGSDITTSDYSILCEQCHDDIYSEWELGIHANNPELNKVCIDCHNPHSPYVIINETLPPVTTLAGINGIPGPIISPTLFFIVIIGALCAAIYAFSVRRV